MMMCSGDDAVSVRRLLLLTDDVNTRTQSSSWLSLGLSYITRARDDKPKCLRSKYAKGSFLRHRFAWMPLEEEIFEITH